MMKKYKFFQSEVVFFYQDAIDLDAAVAALYKKHRLFDIANITKITEDGEVIRLHGHAVIHEFPTPAKNIEYHITWTSFASEGTTAIAAENIVQALARFYVRWEEEGSEIPVIVSIEASGTGSRDFWALLLATSEQARNEASILAREIDEGEPYTIAHTVQLIKWVADSCARVSAILTEIKEKTDV